MPVPDTTPIGPQQRKAAAELLRQTAAPAAELGRIFARNGHQLALVGGPVRDAFLGRAHSDLDLATDATPPQVLAIARGWADKVWETGIEFGTVGLRQGDTVLEITTYRSETYEPDSRKPAGIRYGTSLEADLRRRDFTVNAMAARLPSLELVDPFGGLRRPPRPGAAHPGEPGGVLHRRPAPDDARGPVHRAAGVHRRPGGRRWPCGTWRRRLTVPSAERIRDELSKLLLAPRARDVVRGIELMVDTGVADVVVPEVPKLRLETDEHMRHKDVYQHSLTVLEQAIELEEHYGLQPDLVVRLAALLHDIGKPKTRSLLPDGRVAFHHHEVVGAAMARSRLKALRFASAVVADVTTLIALHLRFHGYGPGEWTDSAVRRYVRDAGPLLTRLHVLTRADCTTRNKAKAARLARAQDGLEQRIVVLSAQEELKKIRPDLDGNQIMTILGLPPGPAVGRAYQHLLELRMEHGPLGPQRATQELLRWAEAEGLGAPPAPPAGG